MKDMDDSISRKAVLSYIDRILHIGTGKNKSFKYIRKYVSKLPPAQPEVITCRDCKKLEVDDLFKEYWCGGNEVTLDHYCGYAERKTDK